MRYVLAPLLLFAAFPTVSPAAESFEGCKYLITSLPAVLSSQGVWCLNADLATAINEGPAISIASNNVTLDCNNFKIGGLSAGITTLADGIFAEDRSNVVVRNCNIRGFRKGIRFVGTNGVIVENNLFDGNTIAAIEAVSADSGTIVRRNLIVDTGGAPNQGRAIGIAVARDVHVVDNIISGVSSDGEGDTAVDGISVAIASGTITGNRISGLVPDGAGTIRGITVVFKGRIAIDGNFIDGGALPGSVGIHCPDDLGLARNNVMLGVVTGVENCTSVGNHADPD